MQKRGISPLIATVLIIGFTIVLAAIIFIWLSGSIEKIITTQKEAEKELACTDVKLDIKKACVENAYLNILVENQGSKEVKAELFRVKGNLNTEIINKDEAITQFGTRNFNLIYNPFITSTLNKLELFPYIDYNNELYQCKKAIEDLIQDCSCPIKDLIRNCNTNFGECTQGVQTCNNDGKWSECNSAALPIEETCDFKDNDCDGSVDEGCSCIAGQEIECGINTGECKIEKQICENEKWSECSSKPEGEICSDNKDNDCDGSIDEICECAGTQTKQCGLTDICECNYGSQTCDQGYFTECIGAIYPQPRDCISNLDNDCNGINDNQGAIKVTDDSNNGQVSIYNDIIIWQKSSIGAYDIYMCNLSLNSNKGGCLSADQKTKVETIATSPGPQPAIYNGVI